MKFTFNAVHLKSRWVSKSLGNKSGHYSWYSLRSRFVITESQMNSVLGHTWARENNDVSLPGQYGIR